MGALEMLNAMGTDEITTLDQLSEIQTKNPPSNVYLPYADNIYDIDLNSRTIYGPSVLSVQRDHKSEVIYFRADRYIDYMDLTNTVCIIQYIVPGDIQRIPHIYIVPYYDIYKFKQERKILFPWAVGGSATEKDGILEYAVKFYKVDNSSGEPILLYSLNTLPTTSEVKRSLEADNNEIMNAEYDIPVKRYEELIYQLQNNKTLWTIL